MLAVLDDWNWHFFYLGFSDVWHYLFFGFSFFLFFLCNISGILHFSDLGMDVLLFNHLFPFCAKLVYCFLLLLFGFSLGSLIFVFFL